MPDHVPDKAWKGDKMENRLKLAKEMLKAKLEEAKSEETRPKETRSGSPIFFFPVSLFFFLLGLWALLGKSKKE